MNFKLWLETTLVLPINKLYGWRNKVEETIQDIAQNRISKTDGPITVSKLDNPRGSYFVIDGHHRIVEAINRNEPTIEAVIDSFIPRIERTGGAYKDILQDKVSILNTVKP